MFSSLSRIYKESSAEETVEKINNLFKTHGLLPEVTYTANPFPEVYSCILSLPPSMGGFSANGKGRTKEYCFASAYAELMERIQNGVYASFSRGMQNQLYEEFGFYYDPGEKFLDQKEFYKLPKEIVDDLVHFSGPFREDFIQAYFERLDSHKAPGVVAVPFLSSKTQENVYIPLNFLLMTVGTNGMAAGNTYDEARYQALCELMERWAVARVYYYKLTPPTVPAAFLHQFFDECTIIENIEKSGKYRVTIKDFSAKRDIPAVGVILHNLQEDTYRLNVGCDTSFQVALSRALTEVFQGFQNEEQLDQMLLEVPKEYPTYFLNDDQLSQELRFRMFCKFTQNGAGIFPPSLFGDEPSYPFDPSIFKTRGSYREEVEGIVDYFHTLGCTIYTRDVSFLGFPSVFVYIPEISSFGKKNVPVMRQKVSTDMISWDKIESRICQIKHQSREDLLALVTVLRTLPAYRSITDIFGIELQDGCPQEKINISFLLAHIYFNLGDLNAAAESFMVYQEVCPDEPEYYRTVVSCLKNMASGKTLADACKASEAEGNSSDLVQQVCDDLKNPDAFFKQLRLPECPNCSVCSLNGDCKTKCIMEISRLLYPVMKKTWQEQTASA